MKKIRGWKSRETIPLSKRQHLLLVAFLCLNPPHWREPSGPHCFRALYFSLNYKMYIICKTKLRVNNFVLSDSPLGFIGGELSFVAEMDSRTKKFQKWGPLVTLTSQCKFIVFPASSWGRVNRLGRSYVTQVDRKIRYLLPLPPATLVQQRPQRVPGFSWLHLSRAGIVSYWPERATHSQSEWRRHLPLR